MNVLGDGSTWHLHHVKKIIMMIINQLRKSASEVNRPEGFTVIYCLHTVDDQLTLGKK